MFDLAIVGGGPAGIAAGVYAARKRLKTVFIAETIGGQSFDSLEIQNWIGTEKISGADLARAFENHLKTYVGDIVELHINERAEKAAATAGGFSITTQKSSYEARALLIATGGSRRKLAAEGASAFENKGLSYCASCDGPLFADQDVVVIGGGNAGFETAAQLLAYCKSVTLVHRNADFAKADATTVEAVLKHPNFHALTSSEPVKIEGSQFVEKIVVKNRETGALTSIPATGIFVEIGMLPSTDFADGLVALDELKRIKVDPKNQRVYAAAPSKIAADARRGESGEKDVDGTTATEAQGPRNNADAAILEGVWSAGDCTDELYHQNNIAAGDGVKALEDIYFWLMAKK